MNPIDFLRLPETREITNIDDPSVSLLHGRIIRRKPFLRKTYVDFYHRLARWMPGRAPQRRVVELGSGGGFFKEVTPDAITSDIMSLPDVDLQFPADNMPFDDASVDGLCMIDVLHHLPDVGSFFREAERCLKGGGRVAMIEPANTWWGRFIYQSFHHERFDPAGTWTTEASGPLSTANGAIPWIVFVRDRRRFEHEYPNFSIIHLKAHTPLRYLLSGGVSMRQLLPSWSYGLVRGIELVLSPLACFTGIYIVLRRSAALKAGKKAEDLRGGSRNIVIVVMVASPFFGISMGLGLWLARSRLLELINGG